MNKYEARQAAREMRKAGHLNAGSFQNVKTGEWFVTDRYERDGTPIQSAASAKGFGKGKG